MASRWSRERKQLLKMLRRAEFTLEAGERLFSDHFFHDSSVSLLRLRARCEPEKMLAFCLRQKMHTAAVFLALAASRMETVTHLVPLLPLEGFRGVTFSMMMRENWDYTMRLVRSRPCLHNDSVFVQAVCDRFCYLAEAAPLLEHLVENCTEASVMNRLLLTVLQDRNVRLLEKIVSIDRFREFLPSFRMGTTSNATILQGLTAEYIRSVDKEERSQYRSMLIGTIRAVASYDFQRQACELERTVNPEVLDRETPLVTAAILARVDLVKLFVSLGLTTDAELSDLRQCHDLKPVPEDYDAEVKGFPGVPGGYDAAAVQEVCEFLEHALPRRLETLCLLKISDAVVSCPDREKQVAGLPIPSVFLPHVLFEKQLEEFELAASDADDACQDCR